MALTFNPATLVIESTASIPDLPAFHLALRDWEDGEDAAVYPVTHTYKRVALGGGANFHAVALVNGWRLMFPIPGNYTIVGNLDAEIIPVAGVYVERRTSAAFVTTSAGSSGLPPEQIALLQAIEIKLGAVKLDTSLIPALL